MQKPSRQTWRPTTPCTFFHLSSFTTNRQISVDQIYHPEAQTQVTHAFQLYHPICIIQELSLTNMFSKIQDLLDQGGPPPTPLGFAKLMLISKCQRNYNHWKKGRLFPLIETPLNKPGHCNKRKYFGTLEFVGKTPTGKSNILPSNSGFKLFSILQFDHTQSTKRFTSFCTRFFF